jgi:hypothetical protein
MSFDTTSSNSGNHKGAAVLLEKLLDRRLINLACRHHVLELIVGKVFVTLFGCSSGPEVTMFARFKTAWQTMNRTNFAPISEENFHQPLVKTLRDQAIEFYKHALENAPVYCLRGDYKELLELSLIVLGESLYSKPYNFKMPGAMHNAR